MKKILFVVFQLILVQSYGQWTKANNGQSPLANNDKGEFDAFYSSDKEGNTYYCWTDFRNGISGDLYAQKLNALGEAQWETNGVRVGSVVSGLNYSLTIKAIQPLSNGNVALVWHRIVNPEDPAEKELFFNSISTSGAVKFNEGKRIEEKNRISNTDVTKGTILITEDSGEIKLAYNTGSTFGSDGIMLARLDSDGNNTEYTVELNKSILEGSKVLFDDINKRIVLLYLEDDYSLFTYDFNGNSILNNKSFLNNPFEGVSRFDDLKLIDGQILIGRTLTGTSQKKVIAQLLDVDFNNVWGTGGVVLGSGTGYDIHTALNEDGGGTFAWVEPNSVESRMTAARINKDGNVLWQKPIFKGLGLNYFTPNKFASDQQNGLYSLWFTPNSVGFDLTVQHIDSDGNQLWGSQGKIIEGYNYYGVYSLLPHISKGLISLYSGSKSADIGDANAYDLYTNYFSPSGEFGLDDKLQASVLKDTYCPGESLRVLFGSEGNYTAEIFQGETSTVLERVGETSDFLLPKDLTNGEYQLVLSQEDGLKSDPIYFFIKSLEKPSLSGDVLTKCADTDEMLTINGVCNLGNILWTSGETDGQLSVSPVITTNYSASCESEGCISSDKEEIWLSIALEDISINERQDYLAGEDIVLFASGGDSYSWSGPNGFISKEERPTIANSTVSHSGTYEVIIGSDLGCTVTLSTVINVNKVLSSKTEKDTFMLYPNPSSDHIKYSGAGNIHNIVLFIPNGQQQKLEFDKQSNQIDIGRLSAGSYLLRVIMVDSSFKNFRFVKQ